MVGIVLFWQCETKTDTKHLRQIYALLSLHFSDLCLFPVLFAAPFPLPSSSPVSNSIAAGQLAFSETERSRFRFRMIFNSIRLHSDSELRAACDP